MKIYITRHGQVAQNTEYYQGDVNLPKGEVLLSELGRVQASLLGKKLKNLGFQGRIFASPLLRTMETAERIAEETGSVIVPTPWMHEIFSDREGLEAYKGCTLSELKTYFPHVDKSIELEYPWWTNRVEDLDMVYERVNSGITTCLEEMDEDILLVGHGASVVTGLKILKLMDKDNPFWVWNCSLSMYDSKQPEQNFSNDVSFLPGEMVSCNKVMGRDIGFHTGGVTLLHIGDTLSDTYDYYRQLIGMVKPDIIIHTGDTADEVKVGRIPGTREEYLEKVQVLLNILAEADCKVYWVPGNNDLPEEIAKLAPFLEVLQPDTVLHIEGHDICVTHSKEQITKKADLYLYGHGKRAESYEAERELRGRDTWCLNVVWNIYVCMLPQKTLYEFARPED